MARLFGTDGVRGLANRDVTAELALDLSVAAAHVLGASGAFEGHRPRAVAGRDTRSSGEFLSAAVIAGLASAGVDVVDVGVLPTPGVAYLTGALGVDIGVVLSASHNPMPDNGIKFFARGGQKLPDDVEDAIEARMREPWDRPTGANVGRITADPGIAEELYIAHLVDTLPESIGSEGLAGLRIAVDCANGASSGVGPTTLRAAGADVVVINASPDGRNINENCGSTHMEPLRAAVVAAEADLGVAFDGDADRCLAVDRTGAVVDGDQIMGILAVAMRDRGELPYDTLVTTVVSNMGLRLAMSAVGIETVQTAVGDRYVLGAMRAGGFGLGGEQTGHLIIARHATTGDGVLTALHLAAQMAQTGKTLAELASCVTRLPQVLMNVPGVDRTRVGTDEGVCEAVAEAEARLAGSGRVLLRSSGTEPLVRLMVEAAELEVAEQVARELAKVVKVRLTL